MGIVINEFEVLADAPPAQRAAASGGEAPPAESPSRLTSQDLKSPVRTLEIELLRIWAH